METFLWRKIIGENGSEDNNGVEKYKWVEGQEQRHSNLIFVH